MKKIYPESFRRGFAPVLIITIVTILLLIGGLIVFGIKTGYHPWTELKAPPGDKGIIIGPHPSPSDPTANWKTYTSQTAHFSIKYPHDWTFFEVDPSTTFLLPPGEIHNSKNTTKDFFVSVRSKYAAVNPVNVEYQTLRKVKIENEEVKILQAKDLRTEKYLAEITRGDFVFEFSAGQNFADKYDSTFDQILSTFKFTSDETANWKTYTNSKYGYSIQYPSNLKLIINNDRPSITNNNNDTSHYFNISIDVLDNTKNQTTQDFVNTYKLLTASGDYKNPFITPKPYANGVIKGIISDVSNGDDFYLEVIQANNGKIYEFKLISGPNTGTKPTDEDRTIFNQILSTFKFTEDIANWKNYTNIQANFSLKYPSTWTLNQKPMTNFDREDGILLKGNEGSLEISWATQFGGGGCEQNNTIQLSNQTIKSCQNISSDGTKTWSLFGWTGPKAFPVVYGGATINAPYQNNEALMRQIFSTIRTPQ